MHRVLACMALFLAACAGGPGREDACVDFMFRDTGAAEGRILSLASPPLVNELNGAFTITDVGFYPAAELDADGRVRAGANRVFLLDFVDHGDIPTLRTDDKRLSLRAELGPGGAVVRALLGSAQGRVSDGFVDFENDRFESGTWVLLYDGPELVVGRLDLKFRKHRVAGNFRAPRLR
ncbi:MAG: hypothetical protein HS108_09000 [Planctomycetes bacterium]|nr:hypothetical protein [Planctomycetota bacterium]MCL4729891.1 hypothetical protein [Planctomycetota bacterium]